MSDYNDGLLPEPCLRLDFGFGQQYASIELGDGSGYVRVAENAKLRELVRQMHPRAKAFLQMCVQLGCNDTLSYDWELQMRELGVEVDG